MSLWSDAMTLFLVMDPIGNVAVFAGILRALPPARRRRVVMRENVIALLLLVFFLLAGPGLMALLRIEGPAMSVAGGLVLLLVALEMIFPGRSNWLKSTEASGEPLIVPLAVPLIAGPSAMALLMLMATRDPGRQGEQLGALLMAWAAGLVLFLLGDRALAVIGGRGLAALERLMGMILIVLAVQMGMSGIAEFLR